MPFAALTPRTLRLAAVQACRLARRPTQTRCSSAAMASDRAALDAVEVKNADVKVAPGETLSAQQRVIVGSVLDLFEGRPSLKHLSLWKPTATFQDPIALAQGYDRFAAQWYGLAALFDPITIQSHLVTSGGNPMQLSLSNKYVVKGIKKEQVVDSVVRIHLGPDGRIDKVQDCWNDELPSEGGVGEALRKLNASIASNLVKVPKTDEEDKQMRAGSRGS